MIKEFNFKNIATIYAKDVEEAKDFMRKNFEISNDKSIRKLLVFTDKDVDGIYEVERKCIVIAHQVPSISWWNI